MRAFELLLYTVILRLENHPNPVIAMQRFFNSGNNCLEELLWLEAARIEATRGRRFGLEEERKEKKYASDYIHGIWKLARKRWRLGVTAPREWFLLNFAFLFHSMLDPAGLSSHTILMPDVKPQGQSLQWEEVYIQINSCNVFNIK